VSQSPITGNGRCLPFSAGRLESAAKRIAGCSIPPSPAFDRCRDHRGERVPQRTTCRPCAPTSCVAPTTGSSSLSDSELACPAWVLVGGQPRQGFASARSHLGIRRPRHVLPDAELSATASHHGGDFLELIGGRTDHARRPRPRSPRGAHRATLVPPSTPAHLAGGHDRLRNPEQLDGEPDVWWVGPVGGGGFMPSYIHLPRRTDSSNLCARYGIGRCRPR